MASILVKGGLVFKFLNITQVLTLKISNFVKK